MSSENKLKETISVLNDLIETSKDGQKGFTAAAGHAHAPELRTLLESYAADCEKSAAELQACVINLGGTPETSGTAVGALHRGWLNLKASVSSDDDLALLEECERGEDHAKAEYVKAMQAPMSGEVRDLLQRQCDGAKVHHDRIRELRNQHREAETI